MKNDRIIKIGISVVTALVGVVVSLCGKTFADSFDSVKYRLAQVETGESENETLRRDTLQRLARVETKIDSITGNIEDLKGSALNRESKIDLILALVSKK